MKVRFFLWELNVDFFCEFVSLLNHFTIYKQQAKI